MLYEPVKYIVEYVVCATLFFIIIMIRYFSSRHFPNQKNSLFSLILWVALADLIVDVLSSLIIENALIVPIVVTHVINTTYYMLQSVLLLLMTGFTMAMSEYLDPRRIRRFLPIMIPGLALLIALLTNPFTRWFFYVDPVLGYIHGPWFISVYIVCLFYTVATLHTAMRNRKKLKKEEFTSILVFLIVVIAATLVQFLFPVLLITGVAITVAVMLMFFTIQNPDSVRDTATDAFTNEAMLAFLKDRANERNDIKLVAIKINNMPRINELLGVSNGSLLLKQVSHFFSDCTKDVWVFRMRGSCFVAITRSDKDYRKLCEQVQKRIVEPWTINGTEIFLQGIVCYVDAAELHTVPMLPEETVHYLESILLQKRRFGEPIKSIRVGADLLNTIQRRKAVEAALREAVENEIWLEIYFQPLWNVKQACYNSAEVLLRFDHPTMGAIAPDEFMPIAEGCGLVTAMDKLVVRKTCAFIRNNKHLRDVGFNAFAINLSAIEFTHRWLPEMLQGIMNEYNVDPSFLYFEITETAATESFELLQSCMKDLCKIGCRFALDDFGTGYANISQVIQLPFSMVKLDRSLLYGPQVVLEDMARMFGRMERLTVIEGVETAEQAEFAQSIGVDYVQGYYYARPIHWQNYYSFLQEKAAAFIAK